MFPIRVKQIESGELYHFIVDSASGAFVDNLRYYIRTSGDFGTGVVYTYGNQRITGSKYFESGNGPIAFASGQLIPLLQLQNTSGALYNQMTGISGDIIVSLGDTYLPRAETGNFAPLYLLAGYFPLSASGNFLTTGQTGNFYPRNNPSGYINTYSFGGVTGISVTGSSSISGKVTYSGAGGITITRNGNTIIWSGTFSGGSGGAGSTGTILNLENSLFVTSGGLDATAQRKSLVNTFATLLSAQNAAISGDTIFVYPGGYTGYNLGKDQVNWYFHLGSIIDNDPNWNTDRFLFTDSSNTMEFNVLGHGTFKNILTGAVDPVQTISILRLDGSHSKVNFEAETIAMSGIDSEVNGIALKTTDQNIVSFKAKTVDVRSLVSNADNLELFICDGASQQIIDIDYLNGGINLLARVDNASDMVLNIDYVSSTNGNKRLSSYNSSKLVYNNNIHNSSCLLQGQNNAQIKINSNYLAALSSTSNDGIKYFINCKELENIYFSQAQGQSNFYFQLNVDRLNSSDVNSQITILGTATGYINIKDWSWKNNFSTDGTINTGIIFNSPTGKLNLQIDNFDGGYHSGVCLGIKNGDVTVGGYFKTNQINGPINFDQSTALLGETDFISSSLNVKAGTVFIAPNATYGVGCLNCTSGTFRVFGDCYSNLPIDPQIPVLVGTYNQSDNLDLFI